MKRVIAVLLSAILAVSFCSCSRNTAPSGSTESSSPAEVQTSSEEPTTAAPGSDKQEVYETLFHQNASEIRYAGDSSEITSESISPSDGQPMTTVMQYYTAGSDRMMHISVNEKGYAVYHIGGITYLYVNYEYTKDGETQAVEKLMKVLNPDGSFSQDDSSSFTIDEEAAETMEVEYLKTVGEEDLVSLKSKASDEQYMIAHFKNGEILSFEILDKNDEKVGDVRFLNVKKIDLPSLEAAEVESNEAVGEMLSALIAISGQDLDPDWSDRDSVLGTYKIEGDTEISQETFSIKFDSAQLDSDYGLMIHATGENKTGNELNIDMESAKINGIEVSPYWSTWIDPEDDLETYIVLNTDILVENRITEIRSLELGIRIYPMIDGENTDDIFNDTLSLTLTPEGEFDEGAIAAKDYALFEYDPDIQVLAESADMSLTITGAQMNHYWGLVLDVEAKNLSSANIVFDLNSAKVNGTECTPFWYEWTEPSETLEGRMIWSLEQLEWNGIEDPETLELELHIMKETPDASEEIFNDTVTIHLKARK